MKKILLSMAAIAAFTAAEAQVYSATDSVDFDAWTFYDLDGDGFTWGAMDWTGSGGWYEPAGGAMNSYSYDNATSAALTPDNLAVAPIIDMSGTVGGTLSWEAGSGETTASGWYEEHYAVYVVTDLTALITGTFPTPVFETTLSAGETLFTESVDVSSIVAGQSTVYVVFRHFDCTDEFTLMIDNVEMSGAFASTNNEEMNVSVYPNPATDVMTFTTSKQTTSVAIYSTDGKLISTEQVNATNFTISVADLAPGVYFYEITNDKGVRSRETFIKK